MILIAFALLILLIGIQEARIHDLRKQAPPTFRMTVDGEDVLLWHDLKVIYRGSSFLDVCAWLAGDRGEGSA